MSTDHIELLKLAAKAAGYSIGFDASMSMQCADGVYFMHDRGYPNANRHGNQWWNPWLDDGDSRRLQIDCGLTLARFPDAMVAMHSPIGRSWAERHDDHGGDSYAAARLAVLRAAAALGRDMP